MYTWLVLVHQRWEKVGEILVIKIRDRVSKNTHKNKTTEKTPQVRKYSNTFIHQQIFIKSLYVSATELSGVNLIYKNCTPDPLPTPFVNIIKKCLKFN